MQLSQRFNINQAVSATHHLLDNRQGKAYPHTALEVNSQIHQGQTEDYNYMLVSMCILNTKTGLYVNSDNSFPPLEKKKSLTYLISVRGY